MSHLGRIALAASIVSLGLPAAAQTYPTQPIIVINPNSAGGGTDVGIRTWQPFVEECLSGTLVPNAHPGGSGAIGNTVLATSDADGYTVGSANMPNLISNWLALPDLPAAEDLEYLGSIVGVRSTINVLRNSEYQTIEQALEFIKHSDGPVNIAIPRNRKYLCFARDNNVMLFAQSLGRFWILPSNVRVLNATPKSRRLYRRAYT